MELEESYIDRYSRWYNILDKYNTAVEIQTLEKKVFIPPTPENKQRLRGILHKGEMISEAALINEFGISQEEYSKVMGWK